MDRRISLLIYGVVNVLIYITLDVIAIYCYDDYLSYKFKYLSACGTGDIKTVNKFLDMIENFKISRYFYHEGLIVACERGRLDVCKLLLKRNPNCVNIYIANPKTEFHLTCDRGNMDIFKLLLSYNVNIHRVGMSNKDGFTYACERGHLEIVKILHKKLLDEKYRPGLISNVLRLFGSDVYDPKKHISSGFLSACERNNIEIVKYFLNEGVDVNVKDYMGRNSFMIACEYGHVDMMKFLIYKNVDISIIDKNNRSALQHCCRGMDTEYDLYLKVLEVLLAAGYDYNHEIFDKYKYYMDEIEDYDGSKEYCRLKHDLYIKTASEIYALIVKSELFGNYL